ncbi:MAG: hypothetical protein ABI151_01140 [Chitinophagaceae bacterium]
MQHLDLVSIKKSYDRERDVILPGLLNQEEVDEINRQLGIFIQDKVPRIPSHFVFYEDENDPETLKQLQDSLPFDIPIRLQIDRL